MRKAVLVLALFSLVVSCRHWCYDHPHVANRCSSSVDVCIDAELRPTPEPVHVRQGDWAHFSFSSGTHDLTIISDVLENIDSCGGQAWGRARNDAPLGKHKYTIVDQTTRGTNDPTVIIDPKAH